MLSLKSKNCKQLEMYKANCTVHLKSNLHGGKLLYKLLHLPDCFGLVPLLELGRDAPGLPAEAGTNSVEV